MKTELNPIVVGIILVVVVGIIGIFIYKGTSGTTFTKDQVRSGEKSNAPGGITLQMGKGG